jgi:thiol-disulfide isomerase/thioredoxin
MSTSIPRYRGFVGAASYGLLLLALVTALAAGTFALFRFQFGDTAFGSRLATRIMIWGGAGAVAAALCRWIAGATTDSLFSLKTCRGDYAAFGALAGLVAAGALTPEGRIGKDPSGTMVGNAVSLAGPTLDGGKFDLSDLRGSVVLVDFWATWCGPCIAELPNLQSVHERYKDAGLKVVSVSLDKDREKLTRFLERTAMPWPQIFFPEPAKQGWDNPLAKQFGVEGIPHMMVVDKEGKLFATDVRGAEVGRAVAAALGGQKPPAEALLPRLGLLAVRGGIDSAPWTLVGCTIGGALVALALELGLRRLFSA